MNILFITKDPPWPPMGGAGLRAYHFIRALGQRHRVSLICYATVRQELELRHAPAFWQCAAHAVRPPSVRNPLRRAVETLSSAVPDVVQRHASASMAHLVGHVLASEQWDVVHLVGLEMASAIFPNYQDVLAEGRSKLVFDVLNVEHLLQSHASAVARRQLSTLPVGVYSWLQSRKLRRYEALVYREATDVVAVSPEDRVALERILPDRRVTVVPNGVDTQRYQPRGTRGEDSPVVHGGEREQAELLFTGTMDYRPNVDATQWFVREILPQIMVSTPEARVTLAGRNPTSAVWDLAGRHVHVTGQIQDDLLYFQNASVYVLPMRFGGGSRLKLLQAMACGLPIVTTTAGAAGVAVKHDEHVWIADTPDEFAKAVSELLKNSGMARRLGTAARALALEYDWSISTQLLEDLYANSPERTLLGDPPV